MTGYETLLKLRELYQSANESRKYYSERHANAVEDSQTQKMYDRYEHESYTEMNCIQFVAETLFPDLDVDFYKELKD